MDMDKARVIQVIETTLSRRGFGVAPDSPVRCITEYWTLDGKKLCEVDNVIDMKAQEWLLEEHEKYNEKCNNAKRRM